MTVTALLMSIGFGTCAESPAKPPPAAIAGTVVDADRRPAAGVGVFYSIFKGSDGWDKVVARTETDARGQFRLEVPGEPGGRPEPGMLWAYRPGALVAAHRINRETLPADWPVSMVLDHPARAEVLVRGPDGRPVAGARIQPRALHHEPYFVPDGLAERIEDRTVTDDRGRAVLSAFFPEEVSTVFISAPGLGRQHFSLDLIDGKPEARTVDLRPVGRVEGRVVADDPEIAANRKLAVLTFDRRRVPALGLFYLRTDPRGRFAIPEIPTGALSVYGSPPAGSPWFLRSPPNLTVEAGKTTRVELEAVKGVRLRGVVRERGTGAPIAGVDVYPYRAEGSEDAIVRTDAEGRYVLFERPGFRPDILVSPPEGSSLIRLGSRFPMIPEGVAEFELPPIELLRGRSVRGIVVDERGEPKPRATVQASWIAREGPNGRGGRTQSARADERGGFLIDGVVAEGDVSLSAFAPDGRRTRQIVRSRAGHMLARLVVESFVSTSLAGRVVDASGRRVGGAKVRIRARKRYRGWPATMDDLVEVRGAYAITTKVDGWFRTPMILDPDLEYAALVDAGGYEPARTAWTAARARTFPEVVLRPQAEQGLAAVEGSVLDRGGKPVAGAAVWIASEAGPPIRATADAGGRFRLEGVLPRRSFLFVEAAGFRFAGRAIDPGADPPSIALTRSDERPPETMTTLPTARPRAEERALARRVLLPYAERVLKEGRPGTRFLMLTSLARVDPGRTLEALANGALAGVDDGAIRLECARTLWERDRDAAIAAIDSSKDPGPRAAGHLAVSRWLPESGRQVRLDQVARAHLLAQGVARGDHKVRLLVRVAERDLDLGEVERGKELLRETVRAARALDDAGAGAMARGSLAVAMQRVDPAAAIDLARWLDDGRPIGDGNRISLAVRLAGTDPARAEALLATLQNPNVLARPLPMLCHALARKDVDRARRLADRNLGRCPDEREPLFARPYALGMIALALAEVDRPRATRILEEAFAALKPLAAEGRRGSPGAQDAASVAAALLPVAERIDPALVPEFFWRAVALRDPSQARIDHTALPDAALAMLLARYDRDAAMVVLGPLLDREPTGRFAIATDVVQALSAVDPARAVARVEAMPEDSGIGMNALQYPKNNARIELANFLAEPPERRWEWITARLLDLWIVDPEDAL